MSLKREIKDSRSPVARFFKELMPSVKPVVREYNQRMRETSTLRPAASLATPPWGTIGTAIDYRLIHTIHPYARASTRYNPVADEEDIRESHRGHVAIYEHLLQRDSEGAAAALEDHISGTWALRKQKRNHPAGAA
jgi:FCD domain